MQAAIFIYVVGSSDGQTERAYSCENRGPVSLQCWQYQTWSTGPVSVISGPDENINLGVLLMRNLELTVQVEQCN